MQLYLLSIKELMEESIELNRDSAMESLQARALQKLDQHRLEKVRKLSAPGAINQAIGAGLLLQLAVQERARAIAAVCTDGVGMGSSVEIKVLSVTEALEKLYIPVEIAYYYDEHGKPDFADASWHFNLSHSGEYVCLVSDEQPVGVDIQQMRPLNNYNLAEKYFSGKEFAQLESCMNENEKVECFYDIWVKKESYAKLTGEGIARTVRLDTDNSDLQVRWQQIDGPEGYRLAVCTAAHKYE